MEKIQVLITTMHKTDLSIYQSMNIRSDAIIANQADRFDYARETIDGNDIQMITTATRGLSRNRNIAMTCADKNGDYIVFADDDIVFRDDYPKIIRDAFRTHPEAEAILFNLELSPNSTRPLPTAPTQVFKKAGRRDVTAGGVVCMAARIDILLKKNMHFNEYFGSGTEYYSGEDTIFLQDMLKNKIALYLSPETLATIDQSESTWYEGYTDKFFEVKGMILAAIYPLLAVPLALRSAYRFAHKKKCGMSFRQIFKCYQKGISRYFSNAPSNK